MDYGLIGGRLGHSYSKVIHEKLADYYTIAQIEAKLKILEDGYTEGDEALSTEISTLRGSLETAKTELTTAYQTAIATAIEQNNGVINAKIAADIKTASDALQSQIDEIKGRLDSIEARLSSLEASVAELIGMVQSIVVMPDYSDGSVRISNTTDNAIRFEVYPLIQQGVLIRKGIQRLTELLILGVNFSVQSLKILAQSSNKAVQFPVNIRQITDRLLDVGDLHVDCRNLRIRQVVNLLLEGLDVRLGGTTG